MDQQEEADEIQGELTRAELEAKLKEAQERLARYEGYQKLMEETGASQLSITDADAKLMKNKNGFAVAYNAQTAVDSETHLIRDFQMTQRNSGRSSAAAAMYMSRPGRNTRKRRL